MDLSKLLLGAVAFDADLVAKTFVTVCHGGIDAEKAPEVDLAFGLDHEALEGDPVHRALRHIADCHAGIESRDQVFLRTGKPVRAAQLQWLVNIHRKAPFHIFAADLKAFDLTSAACLALPGRGDPPAGPAFRRI